MYLDWIFGPNLYFLYENLLSTLFLQRLKAKSKGFKDHIFEANSFSFSHKFSETRFLTLLKPLN